jgi:hypothetical protein
MRQAVVLVALAGLGATAGCAGETCLSGGDCAITPCARLTYACAAPELHIGRVGDDRSRLDLAGAGAADGDLLLQNDRVTLVLAALDEPHDLAPTGGTILDFGPRGGADALPALYQLAGILPDDAFAYRELVVEDRRPELVAVVLRGTLAGRPDVPVVTRYELRPCEPGVRVRSELGNRSRDPLTLFIADGAHWGKKDALPFAPQPGQGFVQPELELLELGALYQDHAYVAARPAVDDGPSYGFVGCDRATLAGVNDPEISALGTRFSLVRSGEGLVLERFLVAVPGGDVAGAVAELAAARRMLHGDPPPRPVRGRVTAGAAGFGGGLRRAAVLIAEQVGGDRRPLTVVVPGDDGGFATSVPAGGPLVAELWSFGRPVAEAAVGDDGQVGPLDATWPATLLARVSDDGGAPLMASVVLEPRDPATADAVRGSWFGRFGDCAPWLGPPHGGSPACNRALIDERGGELEVPPGAYWVYGHAGPRHALARQAVDLVAGEIAEVELVLGRLDLVPSGWVGADLHVHGRRSFDASLPDLDRVASFVAAGVDVVAATDHDVVGEYDEAVAALGVGDRLRVIGGIETTPLIPFLAVPGKDIPRVVGHFNHWPLTQLPGEPRGGAPWDEEIEPGELFDRFDPLLGPDGIQQMNHPWDLAQFGRDTGFLRAIGFDPRRPVPARDDGTSNGILVRAPAGGQRNLDFDTIEIQNGPDGRMTASGRVLWFSLLAQGHIRAGTASSDSHSLTDSQIGYGRTFCPAGPLAGFDVALFNRALKDGRCVGGTAVFITVEVVAPGQVRGLGFTPVVPAGGDSLRIEVRAPPWMPIPEVRVVTSRGERVIASLEAQPDPLGVDGVLRFSGSIALTDVVPAGRDDFIVIEAGMPPFPIGDLDGDGVPETSDNDGDGDLDDVLDPDDDTGPLDSPADPTDESDLRYHLTRVVPRAWPYGFAGPLLIDWAGDGWDPPGLR